MVCDKNLCHANIVILRWEPIVLFAAITHIQVLKCTVVLIIIFSIHKLHFSNIPESKSLAIASPVTTSLNQTDVILASVGHSRTQSRGMAFRHC